MNKDKTSYEVLVLQEKRWVLSQVIGDEAQALAFADNLVTKKNVAAVRVVRDYKRIDGTHSETVLAEKTGSGPQKAEISVVPVSDAPICEGLGEFYALPSRLVMGRMFRKYFDEIFITPTELLHNAKEMKRLADRDRLLMTAVDQIGSLQSPEGGEAAKARREFLHKSVEQLQARAQKAAPEKPAKGLTFKLALERAAGTGDPSFTMLVEMSAYLLEQRGWGAKLDRVLLWAEEPEAAEHFHIIDGWIADLVMPGQSVQDLLGLQPNLGSALRQLLALAEGKAEPAKGAAACFGPLNALFAAGKLPDSRHALLNRVVRELRSANPLSKNEPSQEYECFTRLLQQLIPFEGIIGGAPIAEALTQRYTRVQNTGGVGGMLGALRDLETALGDKCRTTLYLMAMAELAELDPTVTTQILRTLNEFARNNHTLDSWIWPRIPPRERMMAITACNRQIRASSAIEEKLKTELAARTDEALAAYLEADEVIEKIDKPEDPLAFRALRLVKFCGSGALIPGKSLNLAQQRVLGHLRQPQFEEKFLSSIPDKAQAEKHLREFHKLLVTAGFKF